MLRPYGSALMGHISLLLLVLMAALAFVSKVEAARVPPSLTEVSGMYVERDISVIQDALENKSVKSRLNALGYTDSEISTKLSQLSGRELHSLAAQLNALDAGGDNSLGVVIALLVIAVLAIFVLKREDKTFCIH